MKTRTSPDVIFVGSFRFPAGDAAAVRVLGLGKALRESGFRVMFAGVEKRGQTDDLQPDGRFVHQGFPYVSEKDLGSSRVSKVKRAWLTHLSGSTTIRRLRSMDLSGTLAIIAYNCFTPFLWQLNAFCRQQGIALIADCTEWYDPWHRFAGLLALDSELRMRWLQPSIGRVIAISSYLECYYLGRGCSVVRVPPLIDMEQRIRNQVEPRERDDNRLRLVYAGTPGKKDLLGNAIRALPELRSNGLPVELNLVGPSRQAVATCLGKEARLLDELDDSIRYHGRVSHEVALQLVAGADFSILLRPDKRYAHAGFPQKLVESLSLGVPIITNPTSDIAEYVRDGKEGVLLDDATPQAFGAGVRKLFEMPKTQWRAMRANASQRAKDCFDYRQHVQPLKEFLEQAIASGGRNAAGKCGTAQ